MALAKSSCLLTQPLLMLVVSLRPSRRQSLQEVQIWAGTGSLLKSSFRAVLYNKKIDCECVKWSYIQQVAGSLLKLLGACKKLRGVVVRSSFAARDDLLARVATIFFLSSPLSFSAPTTIMSSVDEALENMRTLLACRLCGGQLRATVTLQECGHHFCQYV